MYSLLMYSLRLLKMLHDIGIYEKAVGNITEICEDDYYELALRGLEYVAPMYDFEELGEEVCCGGHVVHHFGDPAIAEYSRLCRLYEWGHGITPQENPYMKKAEEYYSQCCRHTSGDFGAYYDDDVHVKEILIETCPERYAYEHELIELVHDLLEFYRSEVEVLRAELLKGPVVWLPALPAHHEKPKRAKKPRKAANKQLKKAS